MALALENGFRAVKAEVLFYDLVTDRELVDTIHELRRRLGDATPMLIDFGYRWHDWRAALWTLERVGDCDIYLAEAPLQHDDLAGHARLAERVGMRVGGAEFAATRFECYEETSAALFVAAGFARGVTQGWLDPALEPSATAPGRPAARSINRCGGLTEIRRIADLAQDAGAHCDLASEGVHPALRGLIRISGAALVEIATRAFLSSPSEK